jgi:hypothetical protein
MLKNVLNLNFTHIQAQKQQQTNSKHVNRTADGFTMANNELFSHIDSVLHNEMLEKPVELERTRSFGVVMVSLSDFPLH